MDNLVETFTSVTDSKAREDDDFSDRLNHRYTVLLLASFAVFVSITTIVGDPIKCWAPVHFHDSHTAYMNDYCWVRNTYYLPWYDRIPRAGEEREYIGYYQWIVFILLGQAIMFYMPTMVWHGLNSKAGVDADSILSSANKFEVATGVETREKSLEVIANQINRFLGNISDRQMGRNTASGMKRILNKITCGFLEQRASFCKRWE